MNNTVKSILGLIFISWVTLSCNTEKEDFAPKPFYEDENTLVPHTTKVLSSAEWSEYLKEISDDSTILTVSKELIEKKDIQLNDVIVIGEGDGLIKKVKSISTSGDETRIKTEQAALTDVFVNLDIEKTYTKDDLEVDEIVVYEEGVQSNARLDDKNLDTNIGFRIVIADADGNKETTNDQVILEGDFNQIIDFFNLEIKIKDRKLKYFKVSNSISNDTDIKVIYNLNEKIEWKKRILNIKFHRLTIFVGGVPIIIRPQFYLKIGAEVAGEIEFWAGVEYDLTYESGVVFEDDEWRPFFEMDSSFQLNLPDISFGAHAKAYFEPRFALKLYGIVGPYLSGELFAKLEANTAKDPWLQFILGLYIKLGVDLNILNGKISLDKYWILYEKENVIYEDRKYNNPPTAIFTYEPENGNITTTYVFDASESSDFEDGKDGLKYRWDWESDGTWDTGYLNESSIEHKFDIAGNYKVSLEVTDKEGSRSVYSINIVVADVKTELIAYYPFKGNANDESGNGNDGIVHGAVMANDRFDNENSAFIFNGNSNYIELPQGLILNTINSDFSFSLWINPFDITTKRCIISFQGDKYGSVQLRMINSKLELRSNQSENQWSTKIATEIYSYSWSLITVTYSTISGWNLYLNKENAGVNSNNDPFLDQSSKSYLAAKPGPEDFFKGIMDDVRVYNYVLDKDEINDIYSENGWAGSIQNETGSFIDSRDGQEYQWVKIGDQIWMAENLNIGIMINGTKGQTNNGTIEKYCYKNNESNCDVYGGLYQWDEMMGYTSSSSSNPSDVRGICPTGWHVPSDDEWKQLEMYLGLSQTEADGTGWRGIDEGNKLKSTSGWYSGGNGTNSSGFFALPGGYRDYDSPFHAVGNEGNWWSSTKGSSNYVYNRGLSYSHALVYRNDYKKSHGFSIRCLRDE